MSELQRIGEQGGTGPASGQRFRIERGTRASRRFAWVALAVVVALISLPFWGGSEQMRLIAEMSTFLALAILWNLLAGYAGLVSIGQQAFVGLGGYALYIFTVTLGMHPLLGLLLVGVFAAIVSPVIAVAVFRLRGAYFSIGTWVVAEMLRLLVEQSSWLGGGSGLTLTPAVLRALSPTRSGREMAVYWISLGIVLIVLGVVYLLQRSRLGIALTAIRDSERASQSLGVNTYHAKFAVYIVVAFFTGIVGGLILLQKLRISPDSGFSLDDWTVVVIFMVVVGGIGTMEGPIIGMVIYFVLRQLLADYGTWYLMMMGLVAVLIMLKATKGIWGFVSERYDLHLFPVRRTFVRLDASE
jgi:branched-chain amino acid transport system permease protein